MGFLNNLLRRGDMDFLNGQPLSSKFNIIVNILNDSVFDGNGDIIVISERAFNLYPQKTDSQHIIRFFYQMNVLTIQWGFKYYQKEVVHNKDFTPVKNLSIFEQQKIAQKTIDEMEYVIENHKSKVLSTLY